MYLCTIKFQRIMKKQNSILYKGSLSTIILKLLQDNGRMYGYEITQRVKSVTSGNISISEGALYPTLYKLEKEGMLTSEREIVENRVRKYYSITPAGIESTKEQIIDIKQFIEDLRRLLNPEISTLK